MRFSYQTLYSIILNDQIPCFHRKKKSEQTNPNSYSQSQHLWTYPKESLYMFTFYVDFTIKFGFREKDFRGVGCLYILKWLDLMGRVQAYAIRILKYT